VNFRLRGAGLVFGATYVVAAALYVTCAAKAVGGGDWGDFVASASVLGVAHPTGYASYVQILALPLLIFPALAAPAAADVTNALLVALAPALLAAWAYRVATKEGERSGLAVAFASLWGVIFAAAGAVWFEATSVEVYGAALALLFGVLFLLEEGRRRGDDRPFVAAALLGGLASGLHLTAWAYAVLLLGLWLVARRPPARVAALGAAAWVLGVGATLYLPLRVAAAPPLTWTWTGLADLRMVAIHATGRQFSYNFRLPTTLLAALRFRELGEALWRTGGPALLLAPLGWWVVARRSRFAAFALAAVAATNLVFLLGYDIPDLASYQLPLLGVVFAGVAVGALTLFEALRRRPLRLAAVAVAAAAAAYTVAAEWPHQRRDPRFLEYYGRKIVEPVGYEGIYVSGATTSNFLYWLRQYTFGQRPDVELYNINDERFDIDKLAGLLWRSLGARPVLVDYFFLNQTHQRRAFSRQGRPAGFILELTDRPTTPEEAWPLDAEVLARAEEALRATDFAPDRPTHGAELALSVWQYHGTFYEYRGEGELAGYYFQHDVAVAPNSTMPHLNLARWFSERGEYARSREAARRALTARSGAYMWYMAYAYLAMADQAEGDLASAEANARRAVALKPHDGKTHRLLAGIYLEGGDVPRARDELERTVDAGYNDPDAVMMLAQIYRQEGREEEAFALLEENVHDFNDVRLMNTYALALVERGRYVEARAELERALRIDPTSREVRANLARLEAMGW